MSSGSSSTPAISKSINTLPQTAFLNQSQTNPSAGEHHAQRRSGGLGSFGGSITSRTSLPSARNNQSLRKQNRSQKRPRLADEDAHAESAAMKSVNSRKGQTSITHLMNFSLPPRPINNQHYNHNRNGRRNPAWGLGSGYHAVDKARYVHANYRFIVDPKGDYRAQAVDADVHLDWNTVLQILASAQTQSASCPICLSTPTAPRMARCGHIFCLPCLIRYMYSTEDSNPMPGKKARSKKCPLCWDSVYLSETRPVRWFVGQEPEAPQEGGDIVLRLVMRQPGSILALPRDGGTAPSKAEDIPWYFAAEVMDYARVMKGTEEYMLSQFDEEIESLERLEKEDELMFGEQTEWTRRAIRAIRDAKDRVKGMGDPPNLPIQPSSQKRPKEAIPFNNTDAGVPEMYLIQHAAKSGQSSSGGSSTLNSRIAPTLESDSTFDLLTPPSGSNPGIVPPLSDRSSSQSPALNTNAHTTAHHPRNSTAAHKPPTDFPYFFYQALVHYYLSPLDIRVLRSAFGNFAAFPATLLPRVERVSTGHIVDDDLRKRAKYLAHLPYGCEVSFLECNWTDVVAPEILANFKVDIDRRRKKNQDKEMREEKERALAEKEEDDKRWAAARRKRPSVRHESFSGDDFQPFAAPELATNGTSSGADSNIPSTSPRWSSSRVQHESSFASLASPSTSPVAPRTVWGTTAIAPSSPTLHTSSQVKDVPDDDGWLQGWEKDLLQDDDLVAQVQAVSMGESATSNGGTGVPGSGKKKRGKKITLMTTNARRGA